MKRLFHEIASAKKIGLLEAEAIGDHAHLLISVAPLWTLSSVMHQLKGASARMLLSKREELALELESDSLWQKGYGWRGVSPEQAERVRRYIRTQDHRHAERM